MQLCNIMHIIQHLSIYYTQASKQQQNRQFRLFMKIIPRYNIPYAQVCVDYECMKNNCWPLIN